MKRHHQRLLAYAGGVAAIVGGAFLTRVDATAGAALVTAGAFALGAIQKEMLPRPHDRRKDDPPPEPQQKETD